MNQSSGHEGRLGCPLVRLGHHKTVEEKTNKSEDIENYSTDNYNYRTQYADTYEQNSAERAFHNKQLSIDNSYLQKQSNDSSCIPQYYQEGFDDSYETRFEDRKAPPLRNSYHKNLSYPKQISLDFSSLSSTVNGRPSNYWDNNDEVFELNQLDSSNDYFNRSLSSHQNQDMNYLLENFTKLGNTSPHLQDQGYHTLISPSSPQITTNLWSENNVYKGKKGQIKINNCIDNLQDELVVKIFSYLSSVDKSVCARVCKRFDRLIWTTPSLWKVITLEGDNINGDRAIRGVLRQLCGQGRTGACPCVERVHVTDGAKLSDKSLLLLARRCPELTHIQLHGCPNITNNAIFEITTRCLQLQHLDVAGCLKISCISINPNPSGLLMDSASSIRRLQLQYLDLTDCLALQDSGLRVIVQSCPQLAYLYLRRCIQITDAGIKFVPSFCLGLRELSISDCTNITDFGLYELAKLGATLRYLSVAKCDQVSDAGLKVIAKRCYKLRYLNARGCEAVSDDAITILARCCTRLRALDIGKCDVSDAGLMSLAESCPNLKKLSLRQCDLVTDKGVQYIAYYCRGLQQLNIQDCQISLEGYRAVKQYCKRCVIEHTNPGFF